MATTSARPRRRFTRGQRQRLLADLNRAVGRDHTVRFEADAFCEDDQSDKNHIWSLSLGERFEDPIHQLNVDDRAGDIGGQFAQGLRALAADLRRLADRLDKATAAKGGDA